MADNAFVDALRQHDLALQAVIAAQEKIQDRISQISPLSENRTEWLLAFSVVSQSIDVPRGLILGAAYTVATASLKQEWDGVCLLASLKKGSVRHGKTPNLTNSLGRIPASRQRLMQPVAHLSGEGLGRALATRDEGGKGVFYPHPLSSPDLARRLLHERTFLLGHLFLELEAFLDPIEVPIAQRMMVSAMNYLAELETF